MFILLPVFSKANKKEKLAGGIENIPQWPPSSASTTLITTMSLCYDYMLTEKKQDRLYKEDDRK